MGGLKKLIEAYDFGRIVIDGVTYTSDVIIMGKKVEADWWREQGHALEVADISPPLEKFLPEIAIVGTGYMGMMEVPRETRQYFQDKNVELLVENTGKACELFDDLPRAKRALAALNLTC